jgi:hypothetical protein
VETVVDTGVVVTSVVVVGVGACVVGFVVTVVAVVGLVVVVVVVVGVGACVVVGLVVAVVGFVLVLVSEQFCAPAPDALVEHMHVGHTHGCPSECQRLVARVL